MFVCDAVEKSNWVENNKNGNGVKRNEPDYRLNPPNASFFSTTSSSSLGVTVCENSPLTSPVFLKLYPRSMFSHLRVGCLSVCVSVGARWWEGMWGGERGFLKNNISLYISKSVRLERNQVSVWSWPWTEKVESRCRRVQSFFSFLLVFLPANTGQNACASGPCFHPDPSMTPPHTGGMGSNAGAEHVRICVFVSNICPKYGTWVIIVEDSKAHFFHCCDCRFSMFGWRVRGLGSMVSRHLVSHSPSVPSSHSLRPTQTCPSLTSCPRQSPAPAAWFPLCRCGCLLRTPAWCWRLGCATPHRRCRHSPKSPGYGWTRPSSSPTI